MAAIIETPSGGTAIVSSTVVNSGTLLVSGAWHLLEIASGAVVSGGAINDQATALSTCTPAPPRTSNSCRMAAAAS